MWVAEPDLDAGLESGGYVHPSAFLFLVQEMANHRMGSGTMISGLSALRLAVSSARPLGPVSEEKRLGWPLFGSPPLFKYEGARDWYGCPVLAEPLPGEYAEHPIAVLETLGGTALRPRRVETVYKVAYATNEGYLRVRDELRRFYEIMAYPLYIAE